jgi:hypothetical protein
MNRIRVRRLDPPHARAAPTRSPCRPGSPVRLREVSQDRAHCRVPLPDRHHGRRDTDEAEDPGGDFVGTQRRRRRPVCRERLHIGRKSPP